MNLDDGWPVGEARTVQWHPHGDATPENHRNHGPAPGHHGQYSSLIEGLPVEGVNPKDVAGSKKTPLGLLPAAGRIHGAMAAKQGAEKYGPYNWRRIPIGYTPYLDAIERHLLALRDGEDKAADSGVHHLGHIIATASILLDAMAFGTLRDDRPTSGPAAKLLAEMEPK